MSGDLISSQHLSTREVETSLRSVEEREIVYCYHVVAREGGLDTSTLGGCLLYRTVGYAFCGEVLQVCLSFDMIDQ